MNSAFLELTLGYYLFYGFFTKYMRFLNICKDTPGMCEYYEKMVLKKFKQELSVMKGTIQIIIFGFL